MFVRWTRETINNTADVLSRAVEETSGTKYPSWLLCNVVDSNLLDNLMKRTGCKLTAQHQIGIFLNHNQHTSSAASNPDIDQGRIGCKTPAPPAPGIYPWGSPCMQAQQEHQQEHHSTCLQRTFCNCPVMIGSDMYLGGSKCKKTGMLPDLRLFRQHIRQHIGCTMVGEKPGTKIKRNIKRISASKHIRFVTSTGGVTGDVALGAIEGAGYIDAHICAV